MNTAQVRLRISGLDCPSCAAAVERAVTGIDGVLSVQADFMAGILALEFLPDRTDAERIRRAIADLGLRVEDVEPPADRTVLHVAGMDCADELRVIEAALKASGGIRDVAANFVARTLTVTFDPAATTTEAIREVITRTGFPASSEGMPAPAMPWPVRHLKWVLVTASGLALAGGLVARGGELLVAWRLADLCQLGPGRPVTAGTLLFAVAMLAGGYPIARSALRALRRRTFDMNLLMTLAALGAAVIWEWAEAASAMFLFSLALLLESHTMGRARRAVERLMSLAPAEARVVDGGEPHMVPADRVQAGQRVIVRPGETIPVDGLILAGNTEVNQAPVTGESQPVARQAGDEVFAGSINQHGAIEVRSTRAPGDSTLARILHLVQEAESSRAPTQQFVERFARWYTPAVILGAVILATLPPLAFGEPWQGWLFRALVLLVIACPCALVISTPVSIISALAGAARRGILIKGGSHLENLGRVRTFIFDKTGTLTRGEFAVERVAPLPPAVEVEVLSVAAAVEAHSEHLLAEAIRRRAEADGLRVPEASKTTARPGRGTEAVVEGQLCRAGNVRFFEECGLMSPAAGRLASSLEEAGRSVVLVSRGETVLGAVALADRPRDEAARAIAELRRLGARDVVMLTGDNEATARAVSAAVGLDHVHAALLPEAKLKKVEFLTRRDGATAMVGDGVNDAPALAAATVGIAMGAAGTDAALETADVALMTDRLDCVPEAVNLGRRTVRVIRQNVSLALGLKVLVFVLALANVATLWMAVAADMGASLLVIGNGLRLLRGGWNGPRVDEVP